jgi:DNA-binding beta-propeller fold protein YncE
MRAPTLMLVLALLAPLPGQAQTAGVPPFALEAQIALGPVSGRIDHLAVDLTRKLLFVAELGNDSIGVVDLAQRSLRSTMAGFKEPQGIGVEPSSDSVYVANAGDGSVRVLRAEDLTALGRVELGDDADNVRIDPEQKRVVVGYGKGGLAILEPGGRRKIADIKLKAHPEGFQLDAAGNRAWINLPDAELIQLVDLVRGETAGIVPTNGYRGNFPMALDRQTERVLVVFRRPTRLLVVAMAGNAVLADVETCGDADDVFVDSKRHRVYVVCGAGVVDVFEDKDGRYQRAGQFPTSPGARTGLFVAELDRLLLAVRAAGREPAGVWVLRPTP